MSACIASALAYPAPSAIPHQAWRRRSRSPPPATPGEHGMHALHPAAPQSVPTRQQRHRVPGASADPHLALLGCASHEEHAAKAAARRAASLACGRLLADPRIPSRDKHALRMAHLAAHGRSPFACPRCWLPAGVCICARVARVSPATEVWVLYHHSEWGKTSNTGCLASSMLTGARLVLAGHSPHEAELVAAMADPAATLAVLWPAADALTPRQLRRRAAERGSRRTVVVALDANWPNAARLARSFPPDVPRVALPPHEALAHAAASVAGEGGGRGGAGVEGAAAGAAGSDRGGSAGPPRPPPPCSPPPAEGVQPRSLFAPVRRYRGPLGANGRVCTLEAIAALLLGLEGDEALHAALLAALRLKVDVLKVALGRPPVYDATTRLEGLLRGSG